MIRITSKKLYGLLFAIAGLILCTGIVYAALSTRLSVSGTTNVTGGGWDFELKKYESSFWITSTGRGSYSIPTISGTSINDYSVSLFMPGDSVSFKLVLQNNGAISGMIDSVVHSTPTCTSSTGNTADADLVCNNLEYTLTYLDGSELKSNDIIYNNNDCSSSWGFDDTMELMFTIKLNSDLTSVPSSNVTVSGGSTTLNLVQSSTVGSCSSGSN